MQYFKDIFYNTESLSLEDKKTILEDAKAMAYHWWVDILDCNVSMARQKINMDWNDIVLKLDNRCFFSIIYRKGYEDQRSDKKWFINHWCLEIGFCTMKSPEYYLWILVDEKEVDSFIKKWNLKER